MISHYAVLGVDEGAGPDEIRRSYLRLARANHPDVVAHADRATRDAAERRMRELNEAWHVLGDAGRRARYDQQRRAEGVDEGSTFRPFDTGEDDPDPADFVDVPYRADPAADGTRRKATTIAPAACFAAAVLCGSLALALDAMPLLGAAIVFFVASCVGFLVVPLLALARAARDDG